MRKQVMFMVFLSILLMLSACGTSNSLHGESFLTGSNADPGISDSGENDGTQIDSDNLEETGNVKDKEKELMTATGIYNGQADPHTIEIETDEGPLAFQLTMEARDDVEKLMVDEKVTYTYTEDGDFREIESIRPVK